MSKGFTLIELLAVIVILAIIALIATPIVLNIINDAKESATLRSANFYLDGVEMSVLTAKLENKVIKDGIYNILESGNICLEEYDSNTKTCKDSDNTPDNNELIVNVKGDKPSSGTVTITAGQIGNISLSLSDRIVIKNEKGELVYYVSPCTRVTGDKNTLGSLYECEVKLGVKYNFYVLSQESDGTTNLIMDRNINSDGTPTTKAILESDKDKNGGIYNLVSWVSKEDYNDDTNYGTSGNNNKGPLTAMNFLYNATKDWTNIPALSYTYNDKEYQETVEESISYTSFVSNNGVATITSLLGTTTKIGTSDKPLRARMPIYSATLDENFNKVAEKGEVTKKKGDNSNAYLYYYMRLNGCYDNDIDRNEVSCDKAGYIEGVYEEGIENIADIYGYWTLSSFNLYSHFVYYVTYGGGISTALVKYDNRIGVRPVINVKL